MSFSSGLKDCAKVTVEACKRERERERGREWRGWESATLLQGAGVMRIETHCGPRRSPSRAKAMEGDARRRVETWKRFSEKLTITVIMPKWKPPFFATQYKSRAKGVVYLCRNFLILSSFPESWRKARTKLSLMKFQINLAWQ